MKIMFKTIKLPIVIVLIAVFFMSCEREFDSPPIPQISEGQIINLEQLRELHTGSDLTITDSLSVYAVVTMDETSGNLYKEAYVQDGTASMYLRFTSSSGLYEGDSIRIDLQGTTLKMYNMMLQLDSLDADLNIFKQATQLATVSETTTLAEIALDGSSFQAKLVQINNVEFICDDLNNSFADGANQESLNRYLQDEIGNQLIVRTSGYSNFADQIIPSGNGTVTAIVSQYNDDVQILLRRPSEAQLTNDRIDDCDGTGGGSGNGSIILNKNFDDNSVTSGGWTTQLVSGPSNCDWGIYEGSNSAAKASNYYDGINSACESWLISPAVDLTGTAPSLSFRNTYNFSGDPLMLMVSNDYSGTGDPNSANWTDITSQVVWSGGGFEWISSGDIDLSNYTQANVYIAYKYIGSNSDGSTWEIDDVQIINNN
jgi:hypothetical protein